MLAAREEMEERVVEKIIQLKPLRIEALQVEVVGLTPLATHNWSEKAKRQLREQGGPRQKKGPRDPKAEYEASFHRLPDGRPGIPAVAFKSATVQGARNFDGVTMTALKQALFFVGIGPEQLVAIEGEPEMWEAPVKLETGVADLRYRPRFFPWSAVLEVRYNLAMLTAESLINLINAGGLAGVGEWRPSSKKSFTGQYGMYEVKR